MKGEIKQKVFKNKKRKRKTIKKCCHHFKP